MRFYLILFFSFISLNVHAESDEIWHFSLFNPDIQSLPDASQSKTTPIPYEKLHYRHSHCIHLKGIALISPKEWVVWVNGERFTSNHSPQVLQIKAVTHETVTFIWKNQDREHNFKLKVNESYHAPSSKTIKGSCSIKQKN